MRRNWSAPSSTAPPISSTLRLRLRCRRRSRSYPRAAGEARRIAAGPRRSRTVSGDLGRARLPGGRSLSMRQLCPRAPGEERQRVRRESLQQRHRPFQARERVDFGAHPLGVLPIHRRAQHAFDCPANTCRGALVRADHPPDTQRSALSNISAAIGMRTRGRPEASVVMTVPYPPWAMTRSQRGRIRLSGRYRARWTRAVGGGVQVRAERDDEVDRRGAQAIQDRREDAGGPVVGGPERGEDGGPRG